MSRVDLSSVRVEEIVLDEERVPGIDKVNRGIVSDLKVTVQPKEPLEGTIDGVMEGDRVQTIVTRRPKEKLVIGGCDVDGLS